MLQSAPENLNSSNSLNLYVLGFKVTLNPSTYRFSAICTKSVCAIQLTSPKCNATLLVDVCQLLPVSLNTQLNTIHLMSSNAPVNLASCTVFIRSCLVFNSPLFYHTTSTARCWCPREGATCWDSTWHFIRMKIKWGRTDGTVNNSIPNIYVLNCSSHLVTYLHETTWCFVCLHFQWSIIREEEVVGQLRKLRRNCCW